MPWMPYMARWKVCKKCAFGLRVAGDLRSITHLYLGQFFAQPVHWGVGIPEAHAQLVIVLYVFVLCILITWKTRQLKCAGSCRASSSSSTTLDSIFCSSPRLAPKKGTNRTSEPVVVCCSGPSSLAVLLRVPQVTVPSSSSSWQSTQPSK